MLALLILLGLGLSAVGGLWWLRHSLDSRIERFTVFPDKTRNEQQSDVSEPINFLILGSDSRLSKGDLSVIEYGQQRSDAIMVAQLSADRHALTVMSIPRDSWVPIPGHGNAKINAALSWGGIPLTIDTIESVTGISLDHVVLVDFESFKSITDQIGGVDILTSQGMQHMDGETALAFAQTRKTLPQGDFDRMRRQQAWMRAIAQSAFDRNLLSSPTELYSLLRVVASSTLMDDTLTIDKLQSIAFESRGIRRSSVRFITAPYAGTGRSPDGRQSIVRLDNDACAPVFNAFATGEIAHYLDEHPHAAPNLEDRPVD